MWRGLARRASRRRVFRWLAERRFGVQLVLDACSWALAVTVAALLRFDLVTHRIDWPGLGSIVLAAVVAHVLAGFGAGLYRGRWRFGSFEEVAGLTRAALFAGAAVYAITWRLPHRPAPLSVVIGATFFALILMAGVRYGWRLVLETIRRPAEPDENRMLVFGAGEAGAQLVESLLRDPDTSYYPVALLDDDLGKRNLRIMGIPVVGTRHDIERAARARKAQILLIAIPSATAELIGELSERAQDAGLAVKVLPPVRELFSDEVTAEDIRDLTEADLLGRHQIETDIDSIADYLTNKRVLVTGAGGSIGSELCRQIARFGPSELIMLDRDESALHGVQLSIEGRALLDSPNLVLGDIRDIEFLAQLFERRKPQVVFHAAALKHLPMLEQYPGEAVKSNIWGTLSVLEAAAAAGAERFVNISTDKASNPTSVLGYSKRIAERLTAHVATRADGTFLSVRFGNVLGSRGSVLTAFRAQIAAGGPVTVTDPDVTRYFMTVEEAVQLVIQAGAIGRDGEALVLDMGRPVKIDDVAHRLAAQAERPVRIVYTGLRPGEKLHEDLLADDEPDERPIHPLISHVKVPPLEPTGAMSVDPWLPPAKLTAELASLVHTVADRSAS